MPPEPRKRRGQFFRPSAQEAKVKRNPDSKLSKGKLTDGKKWPLSRAFKRTVGFFEYQRLIPFTAFWKILLFWYFQTSIQLDTKLRQITKASSQTIIAVMLLIADWNRRRFDSAVGIIRQFPPFCCGKGFFCSFPPNSVGKKPGWPNDQSFFF